MISFKISKLKTLNLVLDSFHKQMNNQHMGL